MGLTIRSVTGLRRRLGAPWGWVVLRSSHPSAGFENHRPDFKHSSPESIFSRSGFQPGRSGWEWRSSEINRRSSVFENLSSGRFGGSSGRDRRSSILESPSSDSGTGSSDSKTRSSDFRKGSSDLAGVPPNYKRLLRFEKPLLRLICGSSKFANTSSKGICAKNQSKPFPALISQPSTTN